MIKISFPKHEFRMQTVQEKPLIFDEFRKIWVVLTPEEWVRQNFLQYLVQVMQYPASLIAVEREINLGGLRKRFDVMVYKNEKPWMLVECKEMEVPLTDAVITQALAYNSVLATDFIVITNGTSTFALQLAGEAPVWLAEMPKF